MAETPLVYFHADDYGMTPPSDALIRNCQQNGCLNSVSIVPNGALEASVEQLRSSGLKLAVHLNLVEGKALSPAASIPLLVRPDGSFSNSFTGILRLSLSSKRKEFAAQLYQELERQLLAFAALFPAGTPLRIDSHQHVHMIPLVFRTLLQVLLDHHLPVEHLRIPAEPLSPFLGAVRLYPTYSAVNAVKQIVLNLIWTPTGSAPFCRGISALRTSAASRSSCCSIRADWNPDSPFSTRRKRIFTRFISLRAAKSNIRLCTR